MIQNESRCGPQRFSVAVCLLLLLAASAGSVAAGDSADCAVCHEQLGRSFEATVHGRIQAFETADGSTGCETCHDDGAAHIDSEGAPEKIVGFGADMLPEKVAEICMGCHRSESLNDWHGSAHPLNGVGCNDCHRVHASREEQVSDPFVCLECHREIQARLQYPSHHPVREGHMTCGSCHQPHGSSIGMLKTEERPSELCLACHTHLQGPFLFEHEPVYEGCDTCHAPHGAVANNLLLQNEPFLCLQCHELHFHAGLEAEPEESVVVPRYDPSFDPDTPRVTYPDGVPNPWGAAGYKRAFTTKCTQCHVSVHGSDLPSQTVPGQGNGLVR